MNYDEPKNMSRENRLDIEMASWIYQSHLWKQSVIRAEGMTCIWCGQHLYPGTTMRAEDELCLENPKIKEMRRFWIKTVAKGMEDAKITIAKSRTSSPSTETFISGGKECQEN